MKPVYSFLILLCVIVLETACQKDDPLTKDKTIAEWQWETMGKPMGDSEVSSIAIHPENENLWFVTSYKGVYITRNGGRSWEKHFTGIVSALEIDPVHPSRIFAGVGTDLYLSEDLGKTWSRRYIFPKTIASILVSKADNSVYVGIRWENSTTPNGIYKSVDMGYRWTLYSYNVSAKGLIPWDIEEDPVNKKLYIATEIYDHPQPYHPPFLRSSDGGKTWENIAGTLPWHGTRIQVQPGTHNVYVLLEGPGLYYSADFGDHWQLINVPFWLDFIIDQNNPQTFYGGNHVYPSTTGGVYQSTNSGKDFTLLSLQGHIVGSLCMNAKSTALYVAAYKSGIFRAK